MKNPYLIFIIALFSICVEAQNTPVRFQHIDINDGLSLSSVYCIFRDTKGYMWLGTEDGLNRYDGYHFEVLRSDRNNINSICYKWIETITEDSLGRLWFGSRKGLSYFDPVHEEFINYSFKSNDYPLPNDTVTCLTAIKNKVVTGTCNGVALIDVETLGTWVFPRTGRVYSIDQDDDTNVWISCEKGLYSLNLVKGTFHPLILESRMMGVAVLSNNVFAAGNKTLWKFDHTTKEWSIFLEFATEIDIESVESDDQRYLWISTTDGLYSYNTESRIFRKAINAISGSNSLAINTSKVLFKDNAGQMWYGTHGRGLYLINGEMISLYTHNPLDPYSLSQNYINCIYQDQTNGNIWIGTYGAGISIFNLTGSKFDLLKHNTLLINSLSSNFVWSICEASDGWLWVGTNDKGITCYHPVENKYLFYDVDPSDSKALPNTSVREIYQDKSGTIWIGTDGGGLSRFNGLGKGFSNYSNKPGQENSLSDNSVRVIFEDSKGRLWVGTKNGLNCFDRTSETFERFVNDKTDSTTLSHNFIYSSIIEDQQGYLWIGTYGGGLNKFDPDKKVFTHYGTSTSVALSNDIVFAIYRDKDDWLWIGTNEGLNHLNPQTGEISCLTTNEGLPNEVIYSVLPDDNGLLWLSTNKGICSFDPKTGKTRNFDINDGLQSNEFNGGAFHKGNSGKLYFGGVYGLNIIEPGQIGLSSVVHKPVFTRLDVMGSRVQTTVFVHKAGNMVVNNDGQMNIHEHIAYLKSLSLSYSQRFFSIEFSGMNHLFPDKTQYAFQLYPLDKEWHNSGNRNFVSYANIQPGKYVFRVKCSNEDGVWSEELAELRINILPPFWMRGWFITIELFLLLILVVFVYRYLVRQKTNKILRQQNAVIREANSRLKESENHLLALNATKDKFFSIISHDLKNPFTSLMSISDVLTDNYDAYDKEDRKECVTQMHRSIKQIYALLENLLTWSRSQRGKMDFEQQYFNLATTISENINLYRLQAKKKDLKLIYRGPDELVVYADRNTVSTVIRNLLGNAVKFTDDKGLIEVTLSEEISVVKVSVKDNGIGLSEELKSRLFKIDQKIHTEGTHGEKGTGLGLIICKEFVEKNGGKINVESKAGEGSEFWFTIPRN